MTVQKETIDQLASIPNVSVSEGVLLSRHTRFGIGGPADVFVQAASEAGFRRGLASVAGQRRRLQRDRRWHQPDRFRSGLRWNRAAPGREGYRTRGRNRARRRLEPNCRRWWIIRSIRAARPGNHDRHSRIGGSGGLWKRGRLWPFHRRARAAGAVSGRRRRYGRSARAECSFAIARASSKSTRTGSSSASNWP